MRISIRIGRVTALCILLLLAAGCAPGPAGTVQTPFVEGYLEKFHKHNKEEMRAELRARQPMGRLGKPEEMASMVRYLASDEAAFSTGAHLAIDGGLTAA